MFRTRQDYDSKMLSALDPIAQTVASTFLNSLFKVAKDRFQSSGNGSVTTIYGGIVNEYVSAIESNAEHYRFVFNELYNAYTQRQQYSNMIREDVINVMVSWFIPPSHFNSMRSVDRATLFKRIIVDTYREMMGYVLTPQNCRMIIDERDPKVAPVKLKDAAMDILCMQRDTYFSKFMTQISQSFDVVTLSREEYNKIRELIVKLTREKHELKEALEKTGIKLKKIKSSVSAVGSTSAAASSVSVASSRGKSPSRANAASVVSHRPTTVPPQTLGELVQGRAEVHDDITPDDSISRVGGRKHAQLREQPRTQLREQANDHDAANYVRSRAPTTAPSVAPTEATSNSYATTSYMTSGVSSGVSSGISSAVSTDAASDSSSGDEPINSAYH